MNRTVSVILPAHDEAGYLGDCLTALLASDRLPQGWQPEVIVVANGCNDDTAGVARGFTEKATGSGWDLQVIEVAEAGKLNALNVGDRAARGGIRIYLDADATVCPALIGQLVQALDIDAPHFASGQPRIAPARSRFTRAYARFWRRLPFVQVGVPGFGLFAVNAAGRRRWDGWPDIISDDTFARLQFTTTERTGVPAPYQWPMVEGFTRLVRVRRRQNAGVNEIVAAYPDLLSNDDLRDMSAGELASLFVRDPIGFCAYAAVALAVKTPLFRSQSRWARGR